MNRRGARSLWACVVSLLLAGAWPATGLQAQPDTSAIQGRTATAVEHLQNQLDNLSTAEALSDERKRELSGLYRESIENVLLRNEVLVETEKARFVQNNGPETIAEISARLASGDVGQILQDEELLIASDPDSTPPERGLNLVENRIEALVQQLAELNRSLREVQDSSLALSTQLAEARLRLRELTTISRPEQSPGQDPRVTAAEGTRLQTEKSLVEARIEMLEQKLLTRELRLKVAGSRIALAQRQLAILEDRSKQFRDLMALERRKTGDAVQSNITRLDTLSFDTSPLKSLVSENAALVDELEGISVQQQVLSGQLDRLNGLQIQVESSLDNVRQILSVNASGAEVGQLLSKEHSRMPDLKSLRRELKELQNRGISVRLRRLQLQDLQRTPERDTAAGQLLLNVPETYREEIERMASQSLERRRDLLADSDSAYKSYLAAIETLEIGYTRLIQQARELKNLLEARLFWVRSSPPIGIDWWRELGAGIGALFSPSAWIGVLRALVSGLKATVIQSALVLLLVLALLANVRRMRLAMRTFTSFVGRYDDRFRYTIFTLLLSLLRAAPWPLAVFWTGHVLESGAFQGPVFANAVGSALIAGAEVFYIFSVSRLMCRPDGMMRRHFGWTKHAQKVLYRNLGWLRWVILAATFIVVTTLESDDNELVNGVGRFAFMLASLALAWAAWNLLHPVRGVLGDVVSQGNRLWQTRWLWVPLLVGLPVLLFVLTAVGFYFTASEIQNRLFTSGWLGFWAFIVYGMALRWLLVANRKLAYIRALEQQTKDAATEEARAAREQSGDAMPAALEVPTITLDSISAQTRQLVRVFIGLGTLLLLWAIWDDVIPALNFLNEFQLWTRPADADLAFAPGSVTLADLVYCLIVLIVTTASARNLPGLMEVLFLSRLSVDAGTRYAVTTVARYVIVASGFFIAAAILGLDWSKMQWIVAALGVGLGFGLQEIVANFVSGLIILFERPVRVGDTVTVDGVDGTVSRLQIRATTITDWDNREILVPNKNFITGTVTNWTLTNPINRLVVPVGIAYGSDTAKAQEVMLSAVKSIPLILKEPAPTVFFLGFGDSSLNYVVRAFVATLDDRLRGLHEVHSEVEKALREHGFVIPFPQRDVHLWPEPPKEDRSS